MHEMGANGRAVALMMMLEPLPTTVPPPDKDNLSPRVSTETEGPNCIIVNRSYQHFGDFWCWYWYWYQWSIQSSASNSQKTDCEDRRRMTYNVSSGILMRLYSQIGFVVAIETLTLCPVFSHCNTVEWFWWD